MSEGRNSEAQVGRGGLFVLVAKVYFIVFGLAQNIIMKRVLGLDGYGALSTALSAASIAYNPVTQASIQGASRAISVADDEAKPSVQKSLLRLHLFLAVGLSSVFFVASGSLARFLGAPHIQSSLSVLAVVLLSYGIYTPLVGVLNGKRQFTVQAALDALATTLRTVGLVLAAWWTMRAAPLEAPYAATVGFAAASLFVLAIAGYQAGFGKGSSSSFNARHYLAFLLPVYLGQLVLNFLFQADGLLLRKFAADAAIAAALSPRAADPFVGAYRNAQLFCFLPYQLLMSVILVLFPLLSQANGSGDRKRVLTLVRGGVRIAVILAGAFVSVLLASPDGLLRIVFGQDAAALAKDTMRILAVGLGGFAVLGVMTSAQNSLGGERKSLLLTLLAVLLVVLACFVATRGVPLGEGLMLRTALATSLGLLLTTLLATFLLSKQSGGSVLSLFLLVRVVLAIATAAAAGAALNRPTLFGAFAALGTASLLYPLVLVLTRELTAKDLGALRAMVAKKGT